MSWILDSNRQCDLGLRKLYSGFQSPGFQIPQAKFSWIPDSTSKTFTKSGMRIAFYGVIIIVQVA